jgi:hypothetical protein
MDVETGLALRPGGRYAVAGAALLKEIPDGGSAG